MISARDDAAAMVARARDLAQQAHESQVDLQGRPYFHAHLEPIAALLASWGPAAEAAGYLHDIIEDTEVTAEHLLAEGFPPEVVRAVESVSRRDGETYNELISRAASDPLGCLVKLADNASNIAANPALASQQPDRAQRLLHQRYLPARARLMEAARLHGHQEPLPGADMVTATAG